MVNAGTFKLRFRHELETGFPASSLKHEYVIGEGPLSAHDVADQIAYAVVHKVTDKGESLSEAVPELYSDPLPDTESVPNSCHATTVDEAAFEEYEADTTFNVYFYNYRDASICKDGCGFNSKIMDSREQYLEMADKVDELHDEECKGFGPDEPADPDMATLDDF